jgi:4'-phosphopantetheinyl transferase
LLGPGEVHVWWAELDGVGRQHSARTLSRAEQDRAAQILSPGRRTRWVVSRALLREILGHYLNTEPGRIELASGTRGKPRLVGGAPSVAAIDFSLSRSGGSALLAVARDRRVGVDLELPRAVPRAPSLARRAFGAERARELAGLPHARRDAGFLRMWTRHEAELKCAGDGLFGAGDAGTAWWTLELPCGSLAYAAIALDAPPVGVRHWRWRRAAGGQRSEDADGDRLGERRALRVDRQDELRVAGLA